MIEDRGETKAWRRNELSNVPGLPPTLDAGTLLCLLLISTEEWFSAHVLLQLLEFS